VTPDEIRQIQNTQLEDGTFKVLRELCAQVAELNQQMKPGNLIVNVLWPKWKIKFVEK
jgi:hypothetical protein